MNKLLTLGLLCGALSLTKPAVAQAQLNANIEAITSVEKGRSYARGNGFYTISDIPILPDSIKGYTFAEFYPDSSLYGPGFFSKTNLDKHVTSFAGMDLDVRMQAAVGTGFADRAGIGFNASTSIGPAFVSAYFIPMMFESDMKQSKDRNALGYFVSADLPLGITASSFGEMNFNGTEGPEFIYGEICVGRNLGFISNNLKKLSVFYEPAMQPVGPGRAGFKIEHRGSLMLEF